MLEGTPKQAIIVYCKKEDRYAHLLANLISAHTEYEVAEWDEKHWLANQATTSSVQKVIFLGDSREARKRHLGMTWTYNQHNMKYGWLGNQCIVYVDTLNTESITEFCEYYREKTTEHEAINGNPILQLPSDILSDIASDSAEVIEVIEESPTEPIVAADEKRTHFDRKLAIAAKLPRIPKLDLAKLGSDAIAPISNQIIKGKLIRFQFNLIIRIFVYNGGLRDFMES